MGLSSLYRWATAKLLFSMQDWIADLQELYSFIMRSLYPFFDLVKESLDFLKISRYYGKSGHRITGKISFLYSIRHKFRISKILKKITQEPEYKAWYDKCS